MLFGCKNLKFSGCLALSARSFLVFISLFLFCYIYSYRLRIVWFLHCHTLFYVQIITCQIIKCIYWLPWLLIIIMNNLNFSPSFVSTKIESLILNVWRKCTCSVTQNKKMKYNTISNRTRNGDIMILILNKSKYKLDLNR